MFLHILVKNINLSTGEKDQVMCATDPPTPFLSTSQAQGEAEGQGKGEGSGCSL